MFSAFSRSDNALIKNHLTMILPTFGCVYTVIFSGSCHFYPRWVRFCLSRAWGAEPSAVGANAPSLVHFTFAWCKRAPIVQLSRTAPGLEQKIRSVKRPNQAENQPRKAKEPPL
jgi:hypothetical protein